MTTVDDENEPLGTLYRIQNIAVLVESNQIAPPPPYLDSEMPPHYNDIVKELEPENHFLNRLARMIVTFDLVMNLVLLSMTGFMYISDNRVAWILLLPMAFSLIGILGTGAFQFYNISWMMIYVGCYFARFCADVAVITYTFMTGFLDYYYMSNLLFYISIPMMGMRGFYSELFPCYNPKLSNSCESPNISNVNYNYMFIAVFIPQLLGGFLVLYVAVDTFSRYHKPTAVSPC